MDISQQHSFLNTLCLTAGSLTDDRICVSLEDGSMVLRSVALILHEEVIQVMKKSFQHYTDDEFNQLSSLELSQIEDQSLSDSIAAFKLNLSQCMKFPKITEIVQLFALPIRVRKQIFMPSSENLDEKYMHLHAKFNDDIRWKSLEEHIETLICLLLGMSQIPALQLTAERGMTVLKTSSCEEFATRISSNRWKLIARLQRNHLRNCNQHTLQCCNNINCTLSLQDLKIRTKPVLSVYDNIVQSLPKTSNKFLSISPHNNEENADTPTELSSASLIPKAPRERLLNRGRFRCPACDPNLLSLTLKTPRSIRSESLVICPISHREVDNDAHVFYSIKSGRLYAESTIWAEGEDRTESGRCVSPASGEQRRWNEEFKRIFIS